MKFTDILGQEEMKAYFRRAVTVNKIGHAYIINGEESSGKRLLADAFAAFLLCENPSDDSCGECLSCKKAAGNNHPDIIYVTHDKPNTLTVDDIREQLNATVDYKPYESDYKIYIIDDAHKMNEAAQNALLKTIEEPPEYVIIILLTNNANAFLPTVLSRCIQLDMKPVRDDVIVDYLQKTKQIVSYQAKEAAAFAQGNVGKAINLSMSSDFGDMKESVQTIVKSVAGMDYFKIANAVEQIGDYKDNITQYLDLITVWFKDVLLYKSTNGQRELTFEKERISVGRMASEISYDGLNNIFTNITTARQKLKSNVSFDVTIELLLKSLKENM